MPIIVVLVWLLSTIAPPAVSTTVHVSNGSATIYLLNSDPRYEDFIVHVAGRPDISIHAPLHEVQSATITMCGQLDIVIETVSDPPVLFNRFQATVSCRAFLPLIYGAAVN